MNKKKFLTQLTFLKVHLLRLVYLQQGLQKEKSLNLYQ